MNSELILQTHVLDILFENRNKGYGAYTLRKFYNSRLITAIGIMAGAVIILSAFTFLPDSKETEKEMFVVIDPGFGRVPPTPKKPEVKPADKKLFKKTPVSTLNFSSKIVILNNKDSVDVLRDLDNMAIDNKTNIVADPGRPLIGAVPGNNDPGVAGPEKNTEPPIDIVKPLETAEVMPQYPGGMDALRRFLMRNLTNPRSLEEGELISVKVRFVVGYDGILKSFELVQDGGSEFNNEVIRVLKKMPAWIPGKSRGQNVSVYYNIPVKFIPEN